MPEGIERQSKGNPNRFSPKAVARSVIAIPLLEKIEEEARVREELHRMIGALTEPYNVALIVEGEYPGGHAGVEQAVRRLFKELRERQKLLREKAKTAGAKPEEKEPSLKFILEQTPWICLVRLEGREQRQLMALNRQEAIRPILQITPELFDVIIDVNLDFKPHEEMLGELRKRAKVKGYVDPRVLAKALIVSYIAEAKAAEEVKDEEQRVDDLKTNLTPQYVLARLEGRVIQRLAEIDRREAETFALLAEEKLTRAERRMARKQKRTPIPQCVPRMQYRMVFHIWPDFSISTCLTHSVATVKADAAQRSFSAVGEGVVWAVMDSGINASHPHFALHSNVDTTSLLHQDFTSVPGAGLTTALTDSRGHGTHVAGIIAGEQRRTKDTPPDMMDAVLHELDEKDEPVYRRRQLEAITGVAPRCKLVSLKVLDEFGDSKSGNLLAAIAHIQLQNEYGRKLRIHGVNISMGYPFEAKWFACGHSPLCVEINRLVKSGVVVVVAAGNTGYGTLETASGQSDSSLALTINDPGNAELAITVGATHREEPHKYGVSYFSSKGPTGDGRLKPDLIAPGERIVSCAAPGSDLCKREGDGSDARYLETSGTSMAAPHVSGAIAAFLSIRREFIGEPEQVKKIFLSTATDLGRDRFFQGHGLLDLMRAIQSV
jgi:serine protease AprX